MWVIETIHKIFTNDKEFDEFIEPYSPGDIIIVIDRSFRYHVFFNSYIKHCKTCKLIFFTIEESECECSRCKISHTKKIYTT